MIDEIPSGPITKIEIRSRCFACTHTEDGGIDGITVELLKVDISTTVDVLHVLFCDVRITKTVPADWKKGLIVRIAKKGDLTKCGNWRGITLMSAAAKVMGKVLIRRISDGVDVEGASWL